MSSRIRIAAVAAPLAAALVLSGCGYDPADRAGETSAAQATESASADASLQQAGHLVADARVLLRTSDDVLQDPDVPGEWKSIAGQVKGAAADQIGSLGDQVPQGSAMIPGDQSDAVLQAAGRDAGVAYEAMLRANLPRLQQAWAALKDSPDDAVAGVARDMEARMAEIASQLP